MMLGPSRKTNELMRAMSNPFEMFLDFPLSTLKTNPLHMKTDVKETDRGYELAIDLPGCDKKDIDIDLKDGYLSVSASQESESENKDEAGTYIRKERFSGKSSRSFYVGDDIADSDIKARFENGVLTIDVPKKEEEPKLEEKKSISID